MKYWKAIMAATLLLGLSSCGGGDDSDKNDPPPPTPGDPGSVVFTAKAPVFVSVDAPEGAAAKTLEKLAVDFTLKDSKGNPVDVGTTEISFSVTKLIPGRVVNNVEGPSIWKAFIYSGSGTSAKATFEKSTAGTLENLGSGNYRYLFAIDFKNVKDPYPSDSANNGGIIAWDEGLTHRLAVTFGSNDEGSIMPLINYTLDWVPSGASGALTRNILEMESCSDCHMGQPIHHSTRNDPKVCVACHNDSNPPAATPSDPTKTGRNTLAVLVHDFHSTKKASTNNAGEDSSARGADYPQDPRNCDTCHKPATATTPDAGNWVVPTEKTCMSCHSDYKTHNTGKDCRSCHLDKSAEAGGNKAGVKHAHMTRLKAMQDGAATLRINIQSAVYDAATKAVTVELNISKDGVGINDIETELKPFTYLDGGILVNLDEGQGDVLPISSKSVKLKECISLGGGNFSCVTKPIFSDDRVPASDAVLVVTIADMGLCVDKNVLDPGKTGIPALKVCPSFSTIAADRFEYIAAPIVPVGQFDLGGNPVSGYTAPVGANKALCEGCHKNFEIHFGGTAYDHAARDFNQCASCHNAERASHYTGMPGDLKYHVHSYHKMGSHRPEVAASTFPGKINNCESCHDKDQYNIPNQKNERPSKVSKVTNFGKDGVLGGVGENADTRADMYYSPTLVVCSSCHLNSMLGNVNVNAPVAGDEWTSHMKENGAVFGAATVEEATGTEQCASCHAVGQEQGVDKVHKVFNFR